jgi:hypothetical protein
LKFIDPGIIDKQIQLLEDRLVQKGMPEDQIEMTMKITKKIMTAEIAPFVVIFNYIFWGFILSLITSAFIKKEGDPFNSAMHEIDHNQGLEESSNQ